MNQQYDDRGRGRCRSATARPRRSTRSTSRCPRARSSACSGPNGAGKTTGVRILTTLTHARQRPGVGGRPRRRHRGRRRAPQDRRDRPGRHPRRGAHRPPEPGHGRPAQPAAAARGARAGRPSCSSLFELDDAADRVVKGYSGGMRRRLDLAASLVMRPPVLFLDEPTTGLDPTSRQRMWGVIRGLVADGVTVLLTTQYLDEADSLADRIAVIDHGRVIAQGTPRELKAATGSQLLEVTLAAPHAGAAAALARLRRRRGQGLRRRPPPAGRRCAASRASPTPCCARSTRPACWSTTSPSTSRRSTTCSPR